MIVLGETLACGGNTRMKATPSVTNEAYLLCTYTVDRQQRMHGIDVADRMFHTRVCLRYIYSGP
jgi:hypothetical protein